MNEEQSNELITLLKGIDWKLWEMYNMLKGVLATDDAPSDAPTDEDEDDNN